MADEATPEIPIEQEPKLEVAANPMSVGEDSENSASKRVREEDEERKEDGEKKAKVEDGRAVEEQGVASLGGGDGEMEDGKESDGATIGPKTFGSSVEMFDYFFKLLRAWPANLNLNKYEHIMLLDLLKKGHLEAERKIGVGVKAFQVRYHPQFKSRCFFLTRDDESVDDFSFRKCVNHILPLPENMQVKNGVNKAFRGRGGRGRGHGRGR